ncbi:hypothetical protein ACIQ6V_12340 [Streptomyces sp. NPDC096198]|uniref:hypothetical protein n=1 Tax=Streptomyces sp. NPDC096198 TaxID=3366080 RepID=UPI0037FE4AE8
METTAGPSARASDGAAAPAAAETDPPTGIPQVPRVPTASRAPGTRAAPAPTAPRSAPSTTAPARTPAPAPHDPGLCVPIIGLCVGGLSLGG